jgi:DNA-directed RNA polymerase subunit N (RpoN/RPB10)
MIIPVRCFTCNQVLASKYKMYQEIINLYNQEKQKEEADRNIIFDYDKEPSYEAFRLLELNRYCCRRHLLAHVDLIDII